MENVVYEAVPSGLRTNVRSSPVGALSCQHPRPLIPHLLVRSEQECDLPSPRAYITRGNIRVFSDMPRELLHECIAEPPDFRVRLALGVEVGAALATTHVESRQCVLECLFKSKELEDAEVDGGVKAEATLVWSQGGVVLQRYERTRQTGEI